MDTFRRAIVMLFGLCLAISVSIGVMIHGWGLEPKSWWWIISMSFGGQAVAQIIVEAGKAKDE